MKLHSGMKVEAHRTAPVCPAPQQLVNTVLGLNSSSQPLIKPITNGYEIHGVGRIPPTRLCPIQQQGRVTVTQDGHLLKKVCFSTSPSFSLTLCLTLVWSHCPSDTLLIVPRWKTKQKPQPRWKQDRSGRIRRIHTPPTPCSPARGEATICSTVTALQAENPVQLQLDTCHPSSAAAQPVCSVPTATKVQPAVEACGDTLVT